VEKLSAGDFDRLFDEALATLRPLVDASRSNDESEETLRGHGEALDGKLRITAAPGGQLESVELDPRALRVGAEELAAAFKEATNAALAHLQQQFAALPAAIDQAALLERLKEFQAQSAEQMSRYLKAISEAQELLERD
jgi:DNA-binding protein YbaB